MDLFPSTHSWFSPLPFLLNLLILQWWTKGLIYKCLLSSILACPKFQSHTCKFTVFLCRKCPTNVSVSYVLCSILRKVSLHVNIQICMPTSLLGRNLYCGVGSLYHSPIPLSLTWAKMGAVECSENTGVQNMKHAWNCWWSGSTLWIDCSKRPQGLRESSSEI